MMRMNKNIRLLAAFLAVVQFAAAMISCSSDTAGENAADSEIGGGTESNLPDTGVAERDCDGYTYRVFMRGDMGNIYGIRHRDSIWTEGYNGEIVNDAVYNRQLAVEERYNFGVKFIPVTDNASAFAREYQSIVSANDDMFDVAIASCDYQQSSVLGGYTMSWKDLDHVDLEHPCWNQSAINSLSIGDTVFYTMGDMTFDLMDYTYLIYFNKELCLDWGITEESLYDMVLSGKWTLSSMYTLTKDIYTDLDGNGKADTEDLYGITMNTLSGQGIFQNAADALTSYKDENGIPHIIDNTEKLASLIQRMYVILFESQGTYAVMGNTNTRKGNLGWWLMTSYKLANHQSLFSTGLFYELFLDEYRDIDFSMGFLPLPKYDNAQERYQTVCDYGGPFAIVPTTADTDMAGFCAQAFSAYGYELVRPAYYESALKRRYADSDKDAQIVDLIVEGITFDFQSVFTTSSVLSDMMRDKSIDFASYWKKNEKAVKKKFDQIIDTFNEYNE